PNSSPCKARNVDAVPDVSVHGQATHKIEVTAATRKSLGIARHARTLCSDPGERRVHQIHSAENCHLAEAVSGSQPAPEIKLIPVGDVDAHFLYQSWRPRTFQGTKGKAREGQGRTASALRQGLKSPIDLTAPLSMTKAPDLTARGGAHAGVGDECRGNCKAAARRFSRLRTG